MPVKKLQLLVVLTRCSGCDDALRRRGEVRYCLQGNETRRDETLQLSSQNMTGQKLFLKQSNTTLQMHLNCFIIPVQNVHAQSFVLYFTKKQVFCFQQSASNMYKTGTEVKSANRHSASKWCDCGMTFLGSSGWSRRQNPYSPHSYHLQ